MTIYRGAKSISSLVLVSHGFSGSRQMMESISLTLAQAGHTVVAFDYLGHGRNRNALSPEINSLTGATEDLIQQTLEVASKAKALTGLKRVALVGHSMATDVVIRAAEQLPNVDGVVAISMYSEAVTPNHPDRLLIVSGAYETRLRAVALNALGQLGDRLENVTIALGDVERRAVAAPWVGHVGVLWSSVTARETAAWLGEPTEPVSTGLWIAILLGAIVLLFHPVASLLPEAPLEPTPPLRKAIMASVLPAPIAFLAGISGLSVLGLAGFGAMALCLATWGALSLAILRPKMRVSLPGIAATLLVLAWGLALFAVALDRYAAAFLPTGPRLTLMAILLPATLLFALADRALVHGRHLVLRIFLRIPFFAVLLSAMVMQPTSIGMLFTVIPVLALFMLVFGTMAGWAAKWVGILGPGIATGVILSWSIAASTPLFSA
ncbi:MAG: alpha/beta fold hydrolase [Pseudomonadota bacterium]